MNIREQIQKLYCKWCPYDAEAEGLTDDEILACIASSGFADELLKAFPTLTAIEKLAEWRKQYTEARLAVIKENNSSCAYPVTANSVSNLCLGKDMGKCAECAWFNRENTKVLWQADIPEKQERE